MYYHSCQNTRLNLKPPNQCPYPNSSETTPTTALQHRQCPHRCDGRTSSTAATISHRLTAARLLIIYGYEDAPDFIADNAPSHFRDGPGGAQDLGRRLDPAFLPRSSRSRTDDGRAMCPLAHRGHGRQGGKHPPSDTASQRRKSFSTARSARAEAGTLPKPPGSNSPRRQTTQDTPKGSVCSDPGRRRTAVPAYEHSGSERT